jgi:hypothetical protein
MLSRGPVKPKQLRSFGLIVGGVFGLIGVWPLAYRGEPLRLWAVGLALFLILPALIYPRVLTPFYHVWITAGNGMGAIMRPLIMGISFYLVITPIGCVARLFGKDPMRLKSNSDDESYRIVREARPGEHMKHQF